MPGGRRKKVHPLAEAPAASNGDAAKKYEKGADDDGEEEQENGRTTTSPRFEDAEEARLQQQQEQQQQYKTYPKRWLVLCSVLLLNVANYSGWISFAAVTSKAADFYRVSDSQIQLIVTISYVLGIPSCSAATYIFAKWGLKPALQIGAALTFVGSLLCCLSTFPHLRDLTSPAVWYWLALLGQAVTGVASPFIASVPAKVSQHWFPEAQRPAATAVLGLSNPVGLVVGQAATPWMVATADDVPVMNVVWFVPAALGAALTFLTVTSSRPPTPPSRSAALETDQEHRGFLATLKSLLTNRAYLVLVFVVGGAQGYVSAQQIKNEPIMCSLGYSNAFSGLTAALVFVGGIAGSFVLGVAVSRVRTPVLLSKVLCVPLAAVMASLAFVMRRTGVEAAVASLNFVLGFLAMGMYPTLLEFSVEATYPNDESVVVALLIVYSAVQGFVLICADDLLAVDVGDAAKFANETCTQGGGFNEPQNHDSYVTFLHAFGLLFIATYFVFFSTEFKRTAADEDDGDDKEAAAKPASASSNGPSVSSDNNVVMTSF